MEPQATAEQEAHMDRLGPVDAMFLELEKSGPPVAVGAVSEVHGAAPDIDSVRDFVAGRIVGMPRFRQRVEESRSKVRSMKWVDVEPDLTHHVRLMESSGSLDEAVSQLMELPMDADKPLWDLTVLTGYASDRWAFVIRLHHAIADGQGALILIGHLIDMTPDGGFTLADAVAAMSAEDEADGPTPEPSGRLAAAADRAGRSIDMAFEMLGDFISTYPDTMRALGDLMPRRPTALTGQVSGERTWVSGHYPLADVKTARKGYKGATINDLVLAAVAIGFRTLLESRGEDPDGRTLRAVMPVSLRRDMAANNQVGILPAPLPLGDMDAGERIRQIRQATKRSKRSKLPIITDELAKVTAKVTPAPIMDAVVGSSGASSGYIAETLVTNVPGPRVPLYFMGHQVANQTPVIPIEGAMRIIVGITSYADELNIGITGDGEHATDVDVLLNGIRAGFDEILAQATGT